MLCSGLTEGLGVSIESLVGRSPLRDMIVACCKVGKGEGEAGAAAPRRHLICGGCCHLRPSNYMFCLAAEQTYSSLLYFCCQPPPISPPPPFPSHLALQDPDANIRQSGFALVGDLAKACAPHIKPALVSAGGPCPADLLLSMIYLPLLHSDLSPLSCSHSSPTLPRL